MATRGRIGIELTDGSVLSAYHHFDSYPEWLGEKLKQYFNTYELASQLIDGGDMSACIESDDNPTPVYYTQRGESIESNAPRLDKNLAHYVDKEYGEEFHYVYRKVNDQYAWMCIDMESFTDKTPHVVSIHV